MWCGGHTPGSQMITVKTGRGNVLCCSDFIDCYRNWDEQIPVGVFTNLVEWLHRAVNSANYASNIRETFDDVQTRFAIDLVNSSDTRVMLIWLPRNDSVGEKTLHGQFGGGSDAARCV